jgi:hypothetical protein
VLLLNTRDSQILGYCTFPNSGGPFTSGRFNVSMRSSSIRVTLSADFRNAGTRDVPITMI